MTHSNREPEGLRMAVAFMSSFSIWRNCRISCLTSDYGQQENGGIVWTAV